MASPKLSSFLISILVVGFVAGIFSMSLIGMSTEFTDMQFGTNEQDSIEAYNMMGNISSQADETASQLQDIDMEDPDLKDILGGIFNAGYNAMKSTAKSIKVFYVLENNAVNDAKLGAPGVLLSTLLVSIIVILIFIGIIMSAILKRDV
jgi:hypothetical protein